MRMWPRLVPDNLGIWLAPLVWMFIVILGLDAAGLIEPNYRRLIFLLSLSYVACVLFSGRGSEA